MGAGIIGLVLGKELAARGVDVEVYDSKRTVSQDTAKASGIFSKEGLARIGVAYSGACLNTLDGAVIYAGGESVAISANGTKAYVLDRGALAEICAKEAKGAGAKITLGRRLSKAELEEIASDRDIVLVGADGAVSTVASTFGFPKINEYILTYKAEYDGAHIPDLHKAELFFSNKVAGRFFGWTVPYSKGVLEVGVGISSRTRENSTSAFRRFAATKLVTERVGGAKMTAGYASMIPLSYRSRTVVRNVLLVGDAAGQVKATTGGGIIFGASCARIAARCIAAHINDSKPLRAYERAWRRKHGLDLRLHKMIHSSYSMMGDRTLAMAIRTAKLLGIDSFLGTYGDMDRPSLILKRIIVRKAED